MWCICFMLYYYGIMKTCSVMINHMVRMWSSFKYETVFKILFSSKKLFLGMKLFSNTKLFSSMIIRKFSRVVSTCHEGGFGPCELDWTGRPNHSMAARHDTYTHVKQGAHKFILTKESLIKKHNQIMHMFIEIVLRNNSCTCWVKAHNLCLCCR